MRQIELIPELRAHIARKYKTQAEAARAWNLSPAFVSLVLKGVKTPSPVMLDDAQIAAVPGRVRYVRKKAGA